MPVDKLAQEIIALVDEIRNQEKYREQFLSQYELNKNDEQQLTQFLRGKTREEFLEYYSRYTFELLDRIDNDNQRILAEFEVPLATEKEEPKKTIEKVSAPSKSFYLGKRTRKRYLREIGANEEILERLTKKKEKKIREIPEYTVYQTSAFGRLANLFCKPLTRLIINSNPNFYSNISHALRMADIKILSQTYISTQLFTAVIMFIVAFLAGVAINFLVNSNSIFTIVTTLAASVLVAMLTFGVFYYYPATVAGSRNRMIKNDLPFVIIHMAAVAGSGAKPVSIFRLIVSSHEYKGIEGEIRKIVNYVNLFGYDLSTAMKTVATTTPSPKFRDILNGMVATIESGGSLKSYLNQMAEDTMNTYRLERKKYVETLSTYSDIYTGILIAAPLLFIVTLAIINHLGGTLGGLTVDTVAKIGTFGAIPFFNVAFILFLNIIQPE